MRRGVRSFKGRSHDERPIARHGVFPPHSLTRRPHIRGACARDASCGSYATGVRVKGSVKQVVYMEDMYSMCSRLLSTLPFPHEASTAGMSRQTQCGLLSG